MAMKLAMDKKAVFYTVIAILFVGLAIFALSSENELYTESKEFSVIETRVSTMDDFTQDLSEDLERAVYITGVRAINAEIGYIIDEGKFVDNAKLRFNEAFMNGTVMGRKQPLMENSTFPDWIKRVRYQGAKKGILFNVTVKNISIFHISPWALNVTGYFLANVTDAANTAKWNRTIKSAVTISILGFEDPIYVVNSYGRVANVVRKTPYYRNFTTGHNATFNPSHLLNHTLEGYYVNNTQAPSFLMRFENNFSSSQYGIESLVNLVELQDQGLTAETKDIVDYIYWGTQNLTSYKINKMPTWIRIDSSRFGLYMVGGETYS
jgi:hypothetical protein